MPTVRGAVERCARALAVTALVPALCGTICGCSDSSAPNEATFDGERAFADLRDLVAIGPRPAGSTGAERARSLMSDRLRQAGWQVQLQSFEAIDPAGEAVPMTNVVGVLEGAGPEHILLGTHYDTKRIPEVRFVGANDGASGVAVLLELARQLPRRFGSAGPSTGFLIVFFDGEEAFARDMTDEDGLYGSRWLAKRMDESGELERVRALVLVDMVGDADLALTEDLNSSPRLRALVREVARDQGLEGLFAPRAMPVIDDHTPFARRGLEPVLALIDFQYGGPSVPGPRWHTARDDLTGVSAESLNTVGTLLVELAERLEREASATPLEGVR